MSGNIPPGRGGGYARPSRARFSPDTSAWLNLHTDNDGLICAFELAPLSQRSGDILSDGESGSPVWLHFNLSDARAHRWIAGRTSLPEAARATLLETAPRIHVQMLPRGFVTSAAYPGAITAPVSGG